jgi:hypothetical protein
MSKNTSCKRCNGVGYTDVDILPGIQPENCHRCNGTGTEPFWTRSPEAWEIEYRRQATEVGVAVDLQDAVIDLCLHSTITCRVRRRP